MTGGRSGPRWIRSERLRFIAVGVLNTAFGYGCFAALFLGLGSRLPLYAIQLLAHAVSVCNAFLWHRRVTFRSTSTWWPQFVRFNVSYLGALAFGLVTLPLLVKGLHIPALIGAAIITVLTAVVSYLLHRYFSFRPLEGPRPP